MADAQVADIAADVVTVEPAAPPEPADVVVENNNEVSLQELQERVAAAIEGAKQRNVTREHQRGAQSYVHNLIRGIVGKLGWFEEWQVQQEIREREMALKRAALMAPQPTERAVRRRERKRDRKMRLGSGHDGKVGLQVKMGEVPGGGQLLMMLLGRNRDAQPSPSSEKGHGHTVSQMHSASPLDASALATRPAAQRPSAPEGGVAAERAGSSRSAEPLNLQALLNKAGLGDSGEEHSAKPSQAWGRTGHAPPPKQPPAKGSHNQTPMHPSPAGLTTSETWQASRSAAASKPSDRRQTDGGSWSRGLARPAASGVSPHTASSDAMPSHHGASKASRAAPTRGLNWQQQAAAAGRLSARPSRQAAAALEEEQQHAAAAAGAAHRGRRGGRHKDRKGDRLQASNMDLDLWEMPHKPGDLLADDLAQLPEFFRDSKAPPFHGVLLEAIEKPAVNSSRKPARYSGGKEDMDDFYNDMLVGGYLNGLLDDDDDDEEDQIVQKPVVIFQ